MDSGGRKADIRPARAALAWRMDFAFFLGQLCAGLYLLYGGWLCLIECALGSGARVPEELSPKRLRYS